MYIIKLFLCILQSSMPFTLKLICNAKRSTFTFLLFLKNERITTNNYLPLLPEWNKKPSGAMNSRCTKNTL